MKSARQAWRRLEAGARDDLLRAGGRAAVRRARPGRARPATSPRGAPRSGAPSAELVIATFYNFNPEADPHGHPGRLGHRHPRSRCSRPALTRAGAALKRAKDRRGAPALDETLALARPPRRRCRLRTAARPPACSPPHAALGVARRADPPALARARRCFREFPWATATSPCWWTRALGPLEALVLHGATGTIPTPFLKLSRAWPEEEWAATEGGACARAEAPRR